MELLARAQVGAARVTRRGDTGLIKNRLFQPLLSAPALVVAVGLVLVAAGAIFLMLGVPTPRPPNLAASDVEVSSQSKRAQIFHPTSVQWATFTLEPVVARVFRPEHVTEGKIAINEDRSTPIFSPYAGRVTKLMAKPGDTVERGQPLFFIEAADMVQAQNDFLAAVAAIAKARSRLAHTEILERQNRTLHESRAGPLRDWQQAQADLVQARSDLRSAEIALEAARNRLGILGKTDQEITVFQDKGKINSETPIFAPISGTVVQRKVGPGQYVSYTSTGSLDPVFTIGDLSTVWLVAYIRESEAPKVRIGQQLDFTVLAYPDQVFKANVAHVAAALDSNSRRLMVRATVENANGQFKPEMFASVVVFTDEGDAATAVSRDAVIFQADSAHVWVVRDEKTIELRQIKTGVASGKMLQVLQGLQPGEKVVAKGALFVDRAAGS